MGVPVQQGVFLLVYRLKAGYDSLNRNKMWRKMKRFGIGHTTQTSKNGSPKRKQLKM